MNRYESYITTASGRQLHIFLPREEEIHHEDIATGLSNECRWGGQLPEFYSVAQHSTLVGKLAQMLAFDAGLNADTARYIALVGHLHDAAEGLGMRDLPTPIKRFIPEYEAVEHELLCGIMFKYVSRAPEEVFSAMTHVSVQNRMYIEPVLHPLVWKADAIILATENRDLRVKHECGIQGLWHPAEEPRPEVIHPMAPKEAKSAWLARFHELTEGRHL